MENYQSNSHKSKQAAAKLENKKVEKVVSGVAKVKKKSELNKFVNNFISEDATKVGSYLFTDVIVPGIVKMITDALKDGVDIIFKGASSRGGRNSGSYPGNYISYNNFSNNNNAPYRSSNNNNKSVHSPSEITLESKNFTK